jgi:hypothetical protein
MPNFEDGFKALLFALVGGLILSYAVPAVLQAIMGESEKNIAVLINILLILLGLAQLERSKYWGITYTLGYLLGLAFFGSLFMENWEYPIYLLVTGLYLIQKIVRKIR